MRKFCTADPFSTPSTYGRSCQQSCHTGWLKQDLIRAPGANTPCWGCGAGARCRYRHILDKIGPKVSKMCPKYVQTSLCAQNMPKMWPNIKIEPKLCSNTWYFFGHLYQGIWIMPKLQQNAQNLPFTCPNFSYILVTFWGASAKYRKVLKDHQLGQILDKDEFVLCLLRTGF